MNPTGSERDDDPGEVTPEMHRAMRSAVHGKLTAAARAASDTEDIVQSALRTYYRRLGVGKLRPPNRDEKWALLLLIARRKLFQRNRRRSVPTDGNTADFAPDREQSADFQSFLVDECAAAEKALGTEYRTLLESLLNGRAQAEIAGEMGLTRTTVSRMTKRLRDWASGRDG